MSANELIILSYHKFTENRSEYIFSRTYEQFYEDLITKSYDQIHLDDASKDNIEACKIMTEMNIRAKLFVCLELVGQKGYCNWDDLRNISQFHDIENHSHFHVDHSKLNYETQLEYLWHAQNKIKEEIGRAPRYFAAPFNNYNLYTDRVVSKLGLIFAKNRIDILNTTE